MSMFDFTKYQGRDRDGKKWIEDKNSIWQSALNILTAMKADKGYAGLHERGGVTSIINCYFNF